jgi:hypothetical protein
VIEPLRLGLVACGALVRVPDLGARVGDMVDGYVRQAEVSVPADRRLLSKDGDGDGEGVLRATSFDLAVVREVAAADRVLAARRSTCVNGPPICGPWLTGRRSSCSHVEGVDRGQAGVVVRRRSATRPSAPGTTE